MERELLFLICCSTFIVVNVEACSGRVTLNASDQDIVRISDGAKEYAASIQCEWLIDGKYLSFCFLCSRVCYHGLNLYFFLVYFRKWSFY